VPDAIELVDVTVRYRQHVALRNVSLKVAAGEFVGIVGPNGAGKTTLLTLLNGLNRPSSGTVRVLGIDMLAGNASAARKKAGYVAQLENIDPLMPMSVRDVVMIGRYGTLGLLKRPGKDDWRIVDECLKLVGVSHLAARPIGQISGGEQQRVAIARCLAQEPQLMLLDEPTASLDWNARHEIMDLVRKVHDARGLTTLLITHHLSTVPETCDRVVMMKDGAIIAEGKPDKLLTSEGIAHAFNVPVDAARHHRSDL
jgi:ABC-type cobalamin/Fe3+-siderophores transport system ATPase subunit